MVCSDSCALIFYTWLVCFIVLKLINEVKIITNHPKNSRPKYSNLLEVCVIKNKDSLTSNRDRKTWLLDFNFNLSLFHLRFIAILLVRGVVHSLIQWKFYFLFGIFIIFHEIPACDWQQTYLVDAGTTDDCLLFHFSVPLLSYDVFRKLKRKHIRRGRWLALMGQVARSPTTLRIISRSASLHLPGLGQIRRDSNGAIIYTHGCRQLRACHVINPASKNIT